MKACPRGPPDWLTDEAYGTPRRAGTHVSVKILKLSTLTLACKSYLLRRLVDATGGLYHLATEQTEAISLRRFAADLGNWLGLPGGAPTFDGWEPALATAAQLMAQTTRPTAASASGGPLLVLDEFGYLERETPGLPSMLQALYDQIGPGSARGRRPFRLVVCGSAIAVMSALLSGTRALRGRGALELRITPFGYRQAREYWSIESPRIAFAHHALIGGTPGYRDVVPEPDVPEDEEGFGRWVARNVLRPTMPLFAEGTRVVHEDSRMRDTAVYASLLAVIAGGEGSPAKIGGLLGRPSASLTYQLGMLESAGFVHRSDDLLRERRPALSVADPVVRLHHLVIEPNLADLEARRAEQVWARSAHTVESAIFGPHFEALARQWTALHAATEADLEVGPVGQSTVACREHQVSHEIDVLALAPGARARTPGAPVSFIGEAKSRDRRPGTAELRRLRHIGELLTAAGHDARGAVLGLFSSAGFSAELETEAEQDSSAVVLVGLDRLYGLT